jgi:hypothetical protein
MAREKDFKQFEIPAQELEENKPVNAAGAKTLISNAFTNFRDTGRVLAGSWQSGDFLTGSAGWSLGPTGGELEIRSGIIDTDRYYIDQVVAFTTSDDVSGGSNNTFVGEGVGLNNTGNNNVFMGNQSGNANTSGDNNVYIGNFAGNNSTTADNNVSIGNFAGGLAITTGGSNVFLGNQSGQDTTSGNNNAYVGNQSGNNNTTGSDNVFMGSFAGNDNTQGSFNTFIGDSAGANITTSDENTFLGANAGFSNITGAGNVFIGYDAGRNEAGSNKLYIDNSNTSSPLIYGEFDGTGGIGVQVNSPATTAVGFTVKGIASQTANLLEVKDSSANVHHVLSMPGATDPNSYFNKQLGDSDTIFAGDTEANLLRVDAGADEVRLGDWDTNYFTTDKAGDTWWVGGGGLQFGNCYGNEIGWTQANAVQNTWYDISDADMADGKLHGVTHDGSGQLAVSKAGMYAADWSGSFEADAANVHIQIAFSINGTEVGDGLNHFETFGVSRQDPCSGTAILDLAASDTVNVSIRTTDAGTPDLAIDHLMLRLIQIGGT